MKPKCKLTGEDGNAFNIIWKVKRTLFEAGMKSQAEEFMKKALSQGSYDEVLRLCFEYVDVC